MKSFNDIIKKYENYALSDKDIFKIIKGKANLVLYPNLHKYHSIDEVLGPYEACILLFEAKKNYGHWCCLWKLDKNTVSFFNSYGGFPDNSLKYIPYHFANKSNQNFPYLSLLLYNSKYKLTYNERKYQKSSKDIKTCGRHVAVRLLLRDMNDNEYYKFIKKKSNDIGINFDELVTFITI